MRSLSIGNSFSQDACAYLHKAAASAQTDWECVNLYIGGCSLEYHAENLRENRQNYALEINGEDTGRKYPYQMRFVLSEISILLLCSRRAISAE